MRFVFSPACETPLRNPQPYGEQTTGPLKRNCVSILALDLGLLVQYKLVTYLEQTTGGNQRLAHIRDFLGVFTLLPALVLTRNRRCP